jgi:hypothetical protein
MTEMGDALVMTSRWHLAATPQAAWHLVANAAAWPRWWRAMRDVRVIARPPAPGSSASPGRPDVAPGVPDASRHGAALPAAAAVRWRTLLRTSLRLRVRRTAAQPYDLLQAIVDGGLHGTATWVFLTAQATDTCGVDVTLRWETAPRRLPRWAFRLLARPVLEWRHFRAVRATADDMAAALGCPVRDFRGWSGGAHR